MASSAVVPASLFAGLNALDPVRLAALDQPQPGQRPPDDVVSLGGWAAPPAANASAWLPDVASVEALLEGDPELLERFQIALQLLRQLHPGLAQAFVRRIRAALETAQQRSRAPARLDIRVEIATQSTTIVSSSGAATTRQNVEQISIRVSFRSGAEAPASDPIVLDLDRNGIRAAGIEDGVVFDINADGTLDLTSLVGEGDGLLALDRNGNGRIDDGSELFGDQRGASNGFEELRKLDDDHNGVIDSADPVFGSLVVATRGAGADTFVLSSLTASGVEALDLDYRSAAERLHSDVTLAQTGSYLGTDGGRGLLADLLLSYRPLPG